MCLWGGRVKPLSGNPNFLSPYLPGGGGGSSEFRTMSKVLFLESSAIALTEHSRAELRLIVYFSNRRLADGLLSASQPVGQVGLKQNELASRLPRKLKFSTEALLNPTSQTSYVSSHQLVSQK